MLISPAQWKTSLLSIGTALTMTACTDPASSGPGDGDSSDASDMDGERIYRLEVADNGVMMFRIQRDGTELSGRFSIFLPEIDEPGFPPGTIAGDVAENEQYHMTIEFPDPFDNNKRITMNFDGVRDRTKIIGQLGTPGDSDEATLLLLPRKERDPLINTFRKSLDKGPNVSCQVDVTGAEIYALVNADVENALNGSWFKAYDGVAEHCVAGVEAVTGGVKILGSRKHLVSYSIGFSQFSGGTEQPMPTVKHTTNLDTGANLALFGDVLVPGTEAQVVAAAETAIDVLAPFVDAPKLAEMKQAAAAVIDSGATDRFGLEDSGVNLELGLADPLAREVIVPWAALTPHLVPDSVALEFTEAP